MGTTLTFQQRYDLGRAQRKQVRRAEQGTWKGKLRRVDPLRVLADSMRGRVPALIELKYERMMASPFGFFRGAAAIMAADLALGAHTGIFTQLCGDAHVRNVGAFAAPDGRITFDLNDFDETIRGPFEWDVKRMAASIAIAEREALGETARTRTGRQRPRTAMHVFLRSYRTMMQRLAKMPVLEVARFQVHRLHTLQPVQALLEVAGRATPLHSLEALTEPAGTKAGGGGGRRGSRVFRTIVPTLSRVMGATRREVLDALTGYAETLQPERRHFLAQYAAVDVGFKVVGTGSVGLRDYCVYMEGNGPGDPPFLQIKEEVSSAYTPYLGESATAIHQGRRVVDGQRAMQLQSDPFLGWTTIAGREYLVRQLNDHKASVELGELRATAVLEYAGLCGEVLARGHARSGDAAQIAGYMGGSGRFEEGIARFAERYARQNRRDWEELLRARGARPAKG